MPLSHRAQENRCPAPTLKPLSAPTMAKSDRPAFDTRHLAAAHRALLALLAIAILALLPIIIRGGASGRPWTDSPTRLSPWGASRPQTATPEPPMSPRAAPAPL